MEAASVREALFYIGCKDARPILDGVQPNEVLSACEEDRTGNPGGPAGRRLAKRFAAGVIGGRRRAVAGRIFLNGRRHDSMATATLVRQRADQALRQSPIPALRKLRVEENDRAIVLSGSVSSYYLKQLAQESVMPCLGARELHNRVQVVRA